MRLVTRRAVARMAALSWKRQYCHEGRWPAYPNANGRTAESTYVRLVADTNRTVKSVDRIIGNRTWTGDSVDCIEVDRCGNSAAILLGDPDRDAIGICKPCLLIAAKKVSR